jgi:hypothetical protein
LPICDDQVALIVQHLDIGDLVERHHIGLEPVEHGARLLRRTGMRLVDGEVLAGVRLVFRNEFLVDVRVELPRNIVGHIEDVRRLLGECGSEPKRKRNETGEESGHGTPKGQEAALDLQDQCPCHKLSD